MPYDVPNYGFFRRQYIFFGRKQRRCTSMAFDLLQQSGIDLGIDNESWYTLHPHIFYDYLTELGYSETKIR